MIFLNFFDFRRFFNNHWSNLFLIIVQIIFSNHSNTFQSSVIQSPNIFSDFINAHNNTLILCCLKMVMQPAVKYCMLFIMLITKNAVFVYYVVVEFCSVSFQNTVCFLHYVKILSNAS